jgi:hypothetical protein
VGARNDMRNEIASVASLPRNDKSISTVSMYNIMNLEKKLIM